MSAGSLLHLLAGVVAVGVMTFSARLATGQYGTGTGTGTGTVPRPVGNLRTLLLVTSTLLLGALLLSAAGLGNRPWAFFVLFVLLSAVPVFLVGPRTALAAAREHRAAIRHARRHVATMVTLAAVGALVVLGLVLANGGDSAADRPGAQLSLRAAAGVSTVTVSRGRDAGAVLTVAVVRDGRTVWSSAPLPATSSDITVTIPAKVAAGGGTVQLRQDGGPVRSVSVP